MITSPAQLEELNDHLQASGRFALDTEFVSEETFEPVLGLIQVATRDRVTAIDPLARSLDLQRFWDVVTAPGVELVMHAAGEDLRICWLQSGRLPSRIFDVQVAAGFVGYSYPLALGNLVSQSLGMTVASGETRTDWRRRPLSTAQIRYALDDVRYLLDVADHLTDRLQPTGRDQWVKEECSESIKYVHKRLNDHTRWRRLSGVQGLNRRGLEVARRLFLWRQEEARLANRPIRFILRDDLLIGIARRQPKSKRDLEALRDFNRPHLVGKAREILDLIAEANQVPESQLPQPFERFDDGPGLAMIVHMLTATISYLCAQHRIAVALVGTTNDLKALVRWYLDGWPTDQTPALVQGWRGELCGQALLEVLDGRLALRLADLSSDVPITIERIG